MAGGHAGRAPFVVRYLDLVVLALALPVFVIAGWSLLGYAVCAGAWLVQHAVLVAAEQRMREALAAGDRKRALGMIGGSVIGRMWIVTAPILAMGIAAEDRDGLAAALLAAVLVTFHLIGLAASKTLYAEGETA